MVRRVVTLTAVVAALLGACGRPPAPPSAASASTWRTLGSWSGRGDRQTESFDVVTGALRLRWETLNAHPPSGGRLKVALHSSISGRPLQTIVEAHGAGADSATLVDEPRTSYLAVESADVDWRITLEESVPSAPAASGYRPR